MKLLNYIKGLRIGKDARQIEIDAMTDPFLADAIEGYDSVKDDHLVRITKMQKQISARTTTHYNKRWISYASAAAIFIGVVFFTVFNKPVSTDTDNEMLYVYVPEEYLEKKKMEIASSAQFNTPAKIKNPEILAPDDEITIYIPQEYIRERNADTSKKKDKRTTNLILTDTAVKNEVSKGEEDVINIYIPENYQSKEKEKSDPKVQIENPDEFIPF